MNEHKIASSRLSHYGGKFLAATLGIALFAGAPLYAAEADNAEAVKAAPAKKPMPAKSKAKKPANVEPVMTELAMKPTRLIPDSTELVPKMELSLGQSHLLRLPAGVNLEKVKVDDDKLVQVEVTSPREVVIHAKMIGSTVVIIWDKNGQALVLDVSVVGVTVGVDAAALRSTLQQMLPGEKDIKVTTAADSLVLSGMVSDAVKVDKAMALAEAYAVKARTQSQSQGKKVINMLRVAAPQQVMLEVKVAEVTKGLLDRLGASVNATRTNNGITYAIASGFLGLLGAGSGVANSLGGLVTITHGNTTVRVDAQNTDGIINILAEPNIIAISGQEAAFLAGGKIFIPVPQSTTIGTNGAITLQEEDFGVGLKFTPTVLEDGLINLKVAPEVSELAQNGVEIKSSSTGNAILPAFIIRRAATTVQLHDGQSFAIAGLIKNNLTEQIDRFPVLGSIPILGALFRSSQFKKDATELLFVITPRLVKPLPPNYALPTDSFIEPDKKDFFIGGKLEGAPAGPVAPANSPENAPTPQPGKDAKEQQNPKDGFEMK